MTNLRLFYISVLVLYELTVSFTTLTVSARSSVISFLIDIHSLEEIQNQKKSITNENTCSSYSQICEVLLFISFHTNLVSNSHTLI